MIKKYVRREWHIQRSEQSLTTDIVVMWRGSNIIVMQSGSQEFEIDLSDLQETLDVLNEISELSTGI